MALSNEDRKQIKEMIREEVKALIPEFLGRSLVQLRRYFLEQIKN